MQRRDINFDAMYVSDLIRSLDDSPLYMEERLINILMKKFSRLHMTVKPDENRISMDELVGLIETLCRRRLDSSSRFQLLETAVNSIIRNGDFEGVIILSEIPNDWISSIILILTPISYIINLNENSTWVNGYGEKLYNFLVQFQMATEYPDNYVVTLSKVFPIRYVLKEPYNSARVKERWDEALSQNHIGAGVSLDEIMKLLYIVWDIFSNIETRETIVSFICERVERAAPPTGRCLDVVIDQIDENLGKKKITDCEYYRKILAEGLRSFILDNDSNRLKESLYELMNEINSYQLEVEDCYIQVLMRMILCYIGAEPHKSEIFEAQRAKLDDLVQQIAYDWSQNPDTSIYFSDLTTKMEEIRMADDNDPIIALRGIPSFIDPEPVASNSIATEAVHKDSPKMNAAGKKIYKAYRTYKGAEEKVDSQLTKAAKAAGKMVIGDTRKEVIEGKQYTVIGILKKALGTVALFSTGKIKAIIALVVRHALRKKSTTAERRKIIMELETEIDLITEKIDDARGDNNRKAKYAMMRTKKDLENALKRVQYGMEADQGSISGAKAALNNARE